MAYTKLLCFGHTAPYLRVFNAEETFHIASSSFSASSFRAAGPEPRTPFQRDWHCILWKETLLETTPYSTAIVTAAMCALPHQGQVPEARSLKAVFPLLHLFRCCWFSFMSKKLPLLNSNREQMSPKPT